MMAPVKTNPFLRKPITLPDEVVGNGSHAPLAPPAPASQNKDTATTASAPASSISTTITAAAAPLPVNPAQLSSKQLMDLLMDDSTSAGGGEVCGLDADANELQLQKKESHQQMDSACTSARTFTTVEVPGGSKANSTISAVCSAQGQRHQVQQQVGRLVDKSVLNSSVASSIVHPARKRRNHRGLNVKGKAGVFMKHQLHTRGASGTTANANIVNQHTRDTSTIVKSSNVEENEPGETTALTDVPYKKEDAGGPYYMDLLGGDSLCAAGIDEEDDDDVLSALSSSSEDEEHEDDDTMKQESQHIKEKHVLVAYSNSTRQNSTSRKQTSSTKVKNKTAEQSSSEASTPSSSGSEQDNTPFELPDPVFSSDDEARQHPVGPPSGSRNKKNGGPRRGGGENTEDNPGSWREEVRRASNSQQENYSRSQQENYNRSQQENYSHSQQENYSRSQQENYSRTRSQQDQENYNRSQQENHSQDDLPMKSLKDPHAVANLPESDKRALLDHLHSRIDDESCEMNDFEDVTSNLAVQQQLQPTSSSRKTTSTSSRSRTSLILPRSKTSSAAANPSGDSSSTTTAAANTSSSLRARSSSLGFHRSRSQQGKTTGNGIRKSDKEVISQLQKENAQLVKENAWLRSELRKVRN
ncbi:unnamed protein product [Amoebophrya sp. A25]|nr:unnamed protein product [Amoebophrya sp. A25]|eukprot:GSA25T00004986001.1